MVNLGLPSLHHVERWREVAYGAILALNAPPPPAYEVRNTPRRCLCAARTCVSRHRGRRPAARPHWPIAIMPFPASRNRATSGPVPPISPQPATGEKAFVQVKSKAAQAVLDDYVDRFRRGGTYQRMFFVWRSPKGVLATEGDDSLHVWAGDRLADAAVRAGLFDWLTERTA